jgi:hypothetical protein
VKGSGGEGLQVVGLVVECCQRGLDEEELSVLVVQVVPAWLVLHVCWGAW